MTRRMCGLAHRSVRRARQQPLQQLQPIPYRPAPLRRFPEGLLKVKELWLRLGLPCYASAMPPLSALECPDGVCRSHHGGHAVARDDVQRNLSAHGTDWCERLAERIYEISVDSFCQTVMPNLHQQGWQRRHLDWEFKLAEEPAEVERTVVDGTINAMESFLRSHEVQRLFVKELVGGTMAEASRNNLRGKGIRYLIEEELMAFLGEHRDDLLDRMAERLLEDAQGDFEHAHRCASADLAEVEHLLINHAEAVG